MWQSTLIVLPVDKIQKKPLLCYKHMPFKVVYRILGYLLGRRKGSMDTYQRFKRFLVIKAIKAYHVERFTKLCIKKINIR